MSTMLLKFEFLASVESVAYSLISNLFGAFSEFAGFGGF